MKQIRIIDNKNLIAEWDYQKNSDFDPSKLTCGSSYFVWWKCKKGHEWKAVISSRTTSNVG